MMVAVMGSGSAGSRHLRVLKSITGVTPISVPQRTSRIAELEASGYATAIDLAGAKTAGATAAIVATNTGRHLEDAVSAFQNNLDLLLEKPMTVDAAQAHKLCELAGESGRKLYVGCDLRFSKSLNKFRDQLALLGKIHSVRIEAMSYLPDWRPNRPYQETYSAHADEGGVLRDLIHEIDYAGWIFGWPDSCQATIRNLGRLGIASEEIVELNWETHDGCLVSVGLDYLTTPPRRRITAHGEAGTAEWDAFAGTVKVEVDGLPCNTTTIPNEPDHTTMGLDQAFVDACNGTIDDRLADGSDGYRALAVSDAARRSSDSHMTENIEYK